MTTASSTSQSTRSVSLRGIRICSSWLITAVGNFAKTSGRFGTSIFDSRTWSM